LLCGGLSLSIWLDVSLCHTWGGRRGRMFCDCGHDCGMLIGDATTRRVLSVDDFLEKFWRGKPGDKIAANPAPLF